jgi:hypothetical protein
MVWQEDKEEKLAQAAHEICESAVWTASLMPLPYATLDASDGHHHEIDQHAIRKVRYV